MENNRPGIPSFLQKIDTYLLKNKPALWSARTHLVAYFGILLSITLTVICWLAFYNFKQRSDAGIWAGFVGLISFIGLVFWLIFLLRFNVFKRFGNWKKGEGLQTFALYFLNIGIMVWVVFLPFIIECIKTNMQFGNNEISIDINEINETACRLSHSLLPQKFDVDTFIVVTYLGSNGNEAATVQAAEEPTDLTTTSTVKKTYYRYIDTAGLRTKINDADSIHKINDSMYVFYQAPTYQFVKCSINDEYTTIKQLSNIKLYYKIVKNPPPLTDRTALLNRMNYFKEKYFVENNYYNYNKENKQYDDIINERYGLKEIESGIDNITSKKYWWAQGKIGFIRIFLYATFILTLLLFIFRHSTIKTFFLSLLAALVLLILSALFVAVANIGTFGILLMLVLYYLVFAIITGSTNQFKTRTAINGIAINITVFCTYFLPMIITELYYEWQYKIHENDLLYSRTYEGRSFASTMAEIAGLILFIILLEPIFKKQYKKWYALPEA
jgi:hypothetical protein